MTGTESTRKPIALIVVADEPALFFSSTEVAKTYLEAEDVRSGVYPEAFGPNGEPFDITVDRYDNVIIVRRDSDVEHPTRLREILYNFMNGVGTPVSDDMTIPDLIQLCAPYVDDGT